MSSRVSNRKSTASNSSVRFVDAWPVPRSLVHVGRADQNAVLIYDQNLPEILGRAKFKKWAAGFAVRFPVEAGENLKSLTTFAKHTEHLANLTTELGISAQAMTVVAMGGGSVGDFAGFFASVYRRGVDLVHLPTTWLAAIDSAHGGKTALNLTRYKNQIGTFYPARLTVLSKAILFTQTDARAIDAMGELMKMAILGGGAWTTGLIRQTRRSFSAGNSRSAHAKQIWKYLKPAVQAKLQVVARDPMEKKGIRSILNLGHTWGHVIESVHGISHGQAVLLGLVFSLNFSLHRGFLTLDRYGELRTWIESQTGVSFEEPPHHLLISLQKARLALLRDKKGVAGSQARNGRRGQGRDDVQVRFVFVKRIGAPLIEATSVESLLHEATFQGWLKA